VTEEEEIGNPGFHHYRYRGDMEGRYRGAQWNPSARNLRQATLTTRSSKCGVFYGKDGPGPLYQREAFVKDHEPQLSPLAYG